MTVAPPLLEARAVGKNFGAIHALRDVSIAVRPGELVAVVGPDGAGKTTLLRAMTGLVDVDAGVVLVDGTSWRDAPQEARERLGYMPQQYGLYADLSVDENLQFFADLFDLSRKTFQERRAELLSLARLTRAHDRPAGALSGGMYKKLAVACALLHRPSVLVLDEPTNGVDPVSRRELWALLHGLVQAGMGVILATPYMDEAARASRVAMVSGGRVLMEGVPHVLEQGFLHVVLSVEIEDRRSVDDILDDPRVVAVTPAGPRLRAVVPPDSAEELTAALQNRGARITRARPDFEDLYLARVRELRDASGATT